MAKKLTDLWAEKLTQRQKPPGGGIVLIGAPDDRGVYNVGGRVGAASGPAAARSALGKLMLGPQDELATFMVDPGKDIAPTDGLESTHRRLRQATTAALKAGLTPIVVGGGHDYGFPHIGGVADAYGAAKTGLINIDAHLDVRETDGGAITSGSPYFLALEEGCLKGPHFMELGIQAHCNRADRFAYLKAKRPR
jgi:formiminoglutamase